MVWYSQADILNVVHWGTENGVFQLLTSVLPSRISLFIHIIIHAVTVEFASFIDKRMLLSLEFTDHLTMRYCTLAKLHTGLL